MTSPRNAPPTSSAVEVRPEVVFLSELLKELTDGRLRIPRFQRPFVWRRDQMTDLLDSVYNQYPIGSLLVWETDESISTLDHLGPFRFAADSDRQVGYLLDGHQRLSTLAGALVARDIQFIGDDEPDPLRWELAWNMTNGRFQHGVAADSPETLFPLTALLDTLRFFSAVDRMKDALGERMVLVNDYVSAVSRVAQAFQHYRVPVIRIRQTDLSQAVEIFARLNSRGQPMSADQMVSALMFRQSDQGSGFDLASHIDGLIEQLGEQDFGSVDRTTVLRAILANLDEDIYNTDWTRLTKARKETLLPQMREGVERTSRSIDLAVDFLKSLGVRTSRLLPYTMQLATLSAFFDRQPKPSSDQIGFLQRWFWVSSFSGWFGGANPSRVNALVKEFRQVVAKSTPTRLENFEMEAPALPFPLTFDMRSARTRTLLLVMLSLKPRTTSGEIVQDPWRSIAEKGPEAVGHVVANPPRELSRNPANRMIRPPEHERGILRSWLENDLFNADDSVIESYGVTRPAIEYLRQRNLQGFVNERQTFLIDRERELQKRFGVRHSDSETGAAPIDTE